MENLHSENPKNTSKFAHKQKKVIMHWKNPFRNNYFSWNQNLKATLWCCLQFFVYPLDTTWWYKKNLILNPIWFWSKLFSYNNNYNNNNKLFHIHTNFTCSFCPNGCQVFQSRYIDKKYAPNTFWRAVAAMRFLILLCITVQ